MTDSLDTQVQSFMQKLEDRKAQYQTALANRQPWKTNCVLKLVPVDGTDAPKVNIMTCRDLSVLVEAYAWIQARELSIVQAATVLGVQIPTEFLGYRYSDWKADIQNRVLQLQLEEEGRLIKQLESQVEGVMSESQKRSAQISQLAALFN